jgi:hypothetical protein
MQQPADGQRERANQDQNRNNFDAVGSHALDEATNVELTDNEERATRDRSGTKT